MNSTIQIATKWASLKLRGLDLGLPVAPEESAGFGGRVQRYAKGHIYWHHSVGTHEVHGGILNQYLALGGPGFNSATGRREFGFPVTDEIRTEDNEEPISRFEWGAIYWVHGGVWLQGDIYKAYQSYGGETGLLGHPVTSPVRVANGEAVFFERGCLWQPSGGPVIRMNLSPAPMGRPLLVSPDNPSALRADTIITCDLIGANARELADRVPGLLEEIWNGFLTLSPVLPKGKTRTEIPVRLANVRNLSVTIPILGRITRLSAAIEPAPGAALASRQLYDLCLKAPNGRRPVVGPHSIYTKAAWDKFGAVHITDLHVSRRLESMRAQLTKKGHRTGAKHFENWNDALRDFIHYANHLHDIGELDLVLATGDLVDYVFEKGDNRKGGGNFAWFRKILMGQAPYPDPVDGRVAEELRVPIFTTLGNHDYRTEPYDLLARLDAGDFGWFDLWPFHDKDLPNFDGLNLTEAEALSLQDGKKVGYDMPTAADKVRVDTEAQRYYEKWFGSKNSYSVQLGANQLVMLNSRFDKGVVDAGAKDTLKYITGFLSEEERNFLASNPDSEGLTDTDISLVRSALNSSNGAVIVGIHAPPLNPKGNEYPHHFRETEHPSADPTLMSGYLMRADAANFANNGGVRDPEKPHKDWIRTGTPHFKNGSVSNLLDFGVSRGKIDDFLNLCLGVGVSRKVNLVLSGHGHKRVDYRLIRDGTKGLRFHLDFYTENPGAYYRTLYNKKVIATTTPVPTIKVKETRKIHIRVGNPDPRQIGKITQVRDHRPGVFWKSYEQLSVPVYPNTLNDSRDPARWWRDHGPIIVQTAALGPTTNTREDLKLNPERPHPVFQGFRFIAVAGNTITHVRYVTMPELRSANFRLSWEPRFPSPAPLPPIKRDLKTPSTAVPRLKVTKPAGLTATARPRGARAAARKTEPAA